MSRIMWMVAARIHMRLPPANPEFKRAWKQNGDSLLPGKHPVFQMVITAAEIGAERDDASAGGTSQADA